MKKVLTYLSLLIVAFSLIACNSKTPEQQFKQLIQVVAKNQTKLKEIADSVDTSKSVKAVELFDLTDETIRNIKAVKVSDTEIKKFQNTVVEFFELIIKFVDPKTDLATKQDLEEKYQALSKELDELQRELEKKYPAVMEKYPELKL